jgi:hypothetical protein
MRMEREQRKSTAFHAAKREIVTNIPSITVGARNLDSYGGMAVISALQRGAIPFGETRSRLVGALEELEQGFLGRLGTADVVVHQNKL